MLAGIAMLAASLAAPSRSEAACSADFCREVVTDGNGLYTLEIAPGLIAYFAPEFADCKWDVEAVFDDGTPPQAYEFDAQVGLTESHTFPAPGTYLVQIYATKGMHKESKGTCPDVHIEVTAVYPKPPPPPPVTPPTQPPPAPTGGSGKKGSGGGQSGTGASKPSGPSGSTVFWKSCGGEIYAHGVACKKGRKVIKGAAQKLVGRHAGQVAGFGCRRNPAAIRPIACRRGQDRVLGPAS